MMNTLIIAITAGALGVASTGSSVSTSAPKPADAAGGKKICLSYDDVVGSRVRQKECKTKAEWAREGVEVAAPRRN